MVAKKAEPGRTPEQEATPGGVEAAEQFLEAARARKLETATERCAALLDRLAQMFPTYAADFAVLLEEGTPGGDVFAASLINDYERGSLIVEPEPRLHSAIIAAAYCAEGMVADAERMRANKRGFPRGIAAEEHRAWDAALNAAEIIGFISGHKASAAGVSLDEAVKAELRSRRASKAASGPRVDARKYDHDELLEAFHRLVREGHTESEARGIMVLRGDASQPTIHRITTKKKKKAIR
jgi:hypothetical protein